MPIIMCEECDYEPKGQTPKEKLEDMLDHERWAHRILECDLDLALEQAMSMREQEAEEGGLCK